MTNAAIDFNQLLRESRHLETAMEGVTTAYGARSAAANANAGLASAFASQPTHALRVPSLQRNLLQLGAASRRLARQQVPSDVTSDSRAQFLLSSKGIDLRQQQRALKSIDLSVPLRSGSGGVAPLSQGIDSFHPLDIDRFLQHQQQVLCHQAMEEAAKVTSDTYRAHDLNSLSDDWEQAKREILDTLGFRGGRSALGEGVASIGDKRKAGNAATTLHAGPTGPVLAMEQAIYAKTVQELNRARVRKQPLTLLASMKLASAQVEEFFSRSNQNAANAPATGDVADCWDVLQCMLNSGNTHATGLNNMLGQDEYKSSDAVLSEKVFSNAWNGSSTTPDFTRLQSQLIDGAKSYSQQLFESYVRQVVAKYPEARKMQHGKPTFTQQLSAYVSILSSQLPPMSREVTLDSVPFWPQVYFAYRCGHINSALELMNRYARQHAGVASSSATSSFNRTGSMGHSLGGLTHENRALLEVMEKRAMKERSLSNAVWVSLHDEYQREISSAVNASRQHSGGSQNASAYADPFKLALYHLLGRFKLPANFDIASHVTPTTEDYIWMKLSLIMDEPGMSVPESLRDAIDPAAMRLENLQRDLLMRGESAFNPDGRHIFTYFKILLLSQQFEQAIYYLIKTPYFTVGVHFGIVLEYYGLIHTHANNSQELLIALSNSESSSSQGAVLSATPAVAAPTRFALNYSRILRKYVESFVRTHPFESFHYLYLLHTPSSSSSASYPAIRDLLLETRDYDLLIGTIVPSGGADAIQTRGLIYAYYTRAEAQALLVHTATTMEQHGLVTDAIRVYLLAFRFDLGVELLLRALSPLVASSIQHAERTGLVELAQQIQPVVHNQQVVSRGANNSQQLSRNGMLMSLQNNDMDGSRLGEASDISLHALHQMLRLVNYFDLYHLGPSRYEESLVVLSEPEVDLVPFHPDHAADAANKFDNPSATHLEIKRTMSEIAVSLMDIYYVQFQIVKREMQSQHMYGANNMQRDQTKQQRILALRSQARALLSFLGLIHSSMQIDADVFGKLVSIEALMAA